MASRRRVNVFVLSPPIRERSSHLGTNAAAVQIKWTHELLL